MSSRELYQAINGIDEDILERSETASRAFQKKNKILKWAALAACLCLAAVGTVTWKQTRPAPQEDPKITISENGVTIPRRKLSLSANAAADMIAFFIYQGRCYVQYEWLYDAADIAGEYLGTASGLIDEWTPEEDYVELAGSVKGDFYAVKGYDPSFMLCMKEDGAISTYICNSGITLKYGSELYEDRLHLSGNIAGAQYESRASWLYGKGERYQIDSSSDIVLDFIKALDTAQFVPSDSVPLGEGQTHIADTELYHLYFQMADGATFHLRLYENGYVSFQGILDICVQISGKPYHALLDLLDTAALQ